MASKQKESLLSLDGLVRKIVRETNIEIKKEDAKKIVLVIIPEINRIIEDKLSIIYNNIDQTIADRISEHFASIGVFISEKFKKHGE